MPDVQSVNYKEYEFLVFNCLMRMEEILKQGALNIETGWISTKLEAVRNNLACRKFRVAVLGEFDRGKSSFLNAILGRKVLPVSMKPSTAAICRITYGDSPCAWIKTLSQEKKSIPIDELEQYITKLTAKSSKEAERIEEAVVEYPTIICRNGVDLIDTPGLNDEENMSVLSLSLLENIDLAIFVLNAQYPFSLTEAEFVTDLVESEHIKNIIFAVTHMDLICEDEDEAEDLQVREELLADVRKRISQSVLDSLLKRFHQENSSCVQKYHRIFDNYKGEC